MTKRTGQAGFSLFEAMIVAGIGMVLAAATIPNMMTAIANMRLRSSMTSLAGVLQNCRVLSVKENRHMTTHFETLSHGIIAYVKLASEAPGLEEGSSQVQLEAPVTHVTAPSGPGAPSAISNGVLGFTPQTGNPSFSPTGLPCVYSGGTCDRYGFIYYFYDTRRAGQRGWAALSISPAGRMKKWYWNGTAWTD